MSLIGGWSVASDPLYESPAATLPQTQLLAAQPQLALTPDVQSSGRYAPMSVPSTPAAVCSVAWFKDPSGVEASVRKFLQPQRAAVMTTSDAVPANSGCFCRSLIVSPSFEDATARRKC